MGITREVLHCFSFRFVGVKARVLFPTAYTGLFSNKFSCRKMKIYSYINAHVHVYNSKYYNNILYLILLCESYKA